jgi:hypothetical protein
MGSRENCQAGGQPRNLRIDIDKSRILLQIDLRFEAHENPRRNKMT